MGVVRCLLLLLVGCGRLGFDPQVGSDGAVADASSDAATVPAGAKIWLRMETDPTMGIVDSAGNHVVGCTGTCPTLAVGKHARGYRFALEEVDVADAADLDSSAGFTGAIWVDLDALPTGNIACFWTKPFDNTKGYDTFTLCVDPTGTTIFDNETPGGTADSLSGPAITAGSWHHLAMSWDGATKRGYLDGVEVVTEAVAIGHGSDPVALGSSRGDFHLSGIVDDALYYTRALTAAEIAELATP